MATSTGIQLAQSIHQRMEELKKVCEGLDESTASRAPAGRWSVTKIADDNTLQYEMYLTSKGGKKEKMMEMTVTRKR